MEKKLAVIATSKIPDYFKYEDYDKVVYLDYSFIPDRHKNTSDLFLDKFPRNDYLDDSAHIIADSWFRNENSVDIMEGSYSLGALSHWGLSVQISFLIQYFLTIKEWLKDFSKIDFIGNMPNLIFFITDSIKGSVNLIDSDLPPDSIVHRGASHGSFKYKIKFIGLSFFLRVFQSVLHPIFINKILVFSDWTFGKQKNKNYLHLNSKNPIKGFYLNTLRLKTNNSHQNIQGLIKKNISRVLRSYKNHLNSEDFIDVCTQLITCHVENKRSIYDKIYSIYNDIFRFYKPRAIILPNNVTPEQLMCLELAEKYNIKSVISIDGYQTWFNIFQFSLNRLGTNHITRNLVTAKPMKVVIDNLKEYRDINQLMIDPPVLDFFKPNSIRADFDAMILFPYPYLHNPNSRNDLRFKYVEDLVQLSVNKGFKKIILKIKDGDNGDDFAMLEKLMENYKNNIEILITFGRFDLYVRRANIILGGLGSSFVLASYLGQKYYIYEPYELGLSKQNINNSIVPVSFINRSIDKLIKAINSSYYYKLNKNQITYNRQIKDIDFDNLF